MRSKKLRDGAKGEQCTVQLHPYCNMDPSTTVFAHANCEDKGIGFKSPDWWGAYACSDCHDVLDGRKKTDIDKHEIDECFVRGIYRTLKRRIDQDLIIIK